MPLPMVHLAVAMHLYRQEENTPSPDFLLGSIAPDAIHMRPNAGRDDKRRVHLSEAHDPHHERARSLLAGYRSDESTALGFAEGYAAHLLTDYLWVETVIDSFRRSIPPGLSDQEERSLYYLETDQIDFCLYHRMPWRAEVWSKLAAAQPRDFSPLLTAEEIGQWRDRTLVWFEELKQEPMIEPVYITYADVEAFIDQAAHETMRAFAALNLKHDAGER
jgi:hypothetical protein